MNRTEEVPTVIRVLVVDDSAFMRASLTRIISSESGIEVVATARSGLDALQKIASVDPDVVTMDVQMPELDGLETLRIIMRKFPRPVIMVSSVTEKDAEITFSALNAGAFDYVPKQMSEVSLEIAHIRSDLISKIRAAADARHGRLFYSRTKKPAASVSDPSCTSRSDPPSVVVIGTSTGGPKALQELLPQFPREFPVPLLIVQHMPAGFTRPFAQRLSRYCSISVREARDGEFIEPGTAYIAPASMHMRVQRHAPDSRCFVVLDRHLGDLAHVPSIDVLMTSVAEGYGRAAVGVIMTGMGRDGAEGMRAIHEHGGVTIGQDQASCAIYGMPRVCAEIGVLDSVVPLSQIANRLFRITGYRRRA